MSRVKKREKKATVDLNVHKRMIKVKMNQPWKILVPVQEWLPSQVAHHEVETERVVEAVGVTFGLQTTHDVEATWCEDDAEGDPETAVRGQSSSTKGVTDSHFPGTD